MYIYIYTIKYFYQKTSQKCLLRVFVVYLVLKDLLKYIIPRFTDAHCLVDISFILLSYEYICLFTCIY